MADSMNRAEAIVDKTNITGALLIISCLYLY